MAGLTGVHLLVLLIPVAVLAGVAAGAYFLIRRAVAAGVRDGQRKAASREDRLQ